MAAYNDALQFFSSASPPQYEDFPQVPNGTTLFVRLIEITWATTGGVPSPGGALMAFGSATAAGGVGFVQYDLWVPAQATSGQLIVPYPNPLVIAGTLFPCFFQQNMPAAAATLFAVALHGSVA